MLPIGTPAINMPSPEPSPKNPQKRPKTHKKQTHVLIRSNTLKRLFYKACKVFFTAVYHPIIYGVSFINENIHIINRIALRAYKTLIFSSLYLSLNVLYLQFHPHKNHY